MILSRTILREFFLYAGFGAGLFCLILVGGDMFLGGGRALLEAHAASQLLPYGACRLPQAFGFALPMACLLGTLLTVGRMSSANELVAVRCGGVSTSRALRPLFVVGTLAALALTVANLQLTPRATLAADRMVVASLANSALATGFNLPPQVSDNGDEVLVSALAYQREGQSMHGVTATVFREGRRVREVYADEAAWTGDCWSLTGVSMHDLGARESSWTARQLLSRTLVGLDLPTPQALDRLRHRPDEMTLSELGITARASVPSEARALWLRFHQRLAIPWACFIFVIFSAPVAVAPHRSGLSAGFGSALALSGLYYLVATLAALLCGEGMLAPWLAAWCPNALFALASWGLWRAGRGRL